MIYNNFHQLVINETPLMDVRAPIEFEKGAFQTSCNLPIMNDEERRLVGIKYKNAGNEKATALGFQLVSGDIKDQRVQAWKDFYDTHPDVKFYCFRGGSRSQIAQQWMKEIYDLDIPRLDGGYKAFRNYLIQALEPESITMKPLILGGCTGSGKTILLNKLKNTIDLEGIANHRGSSFGRHATPQPSQINFENNLAYKIIQQQEKGYKYMLLEDEGVHVGSCYLPKPLLGYFNTGDLVIVDVDLDKRTEITLDEYVTVAQQEYIDHASSIEEGMNQWFEYIIASVTRLKKSLGGDRLKSMLDLVHAAYDHQLKTGDISLHKSWIYLFLKDYYDPMYQYQINSNTKNIVFRGNEDEVFQYLKEKA
ncbi:MAG: tRNA 2-selenouridine(34) synthase MnmH [Eubacteriales bacterium]